MDAFLDSTTLLGAWFLGFTSVFIWAVVESLFEPFVSVPMTTTHLTTIPITTRIPSSDATFKCLALSELRAAAKEDITITGARRAGIFGEYGNSPNLWRRISHDCLLNLDDGHWHFSRPGQPAPAAPLPSPATTTPLSDKVTATPAQVFRGPIFQSGGKSSPIIVDAVAADGPTGKAAEMFRSLEAQLPLGEEVNQDSNTKPGFLAWVKAELDVAVRSTSEKLFPVLVRDVW